MSAKRVDDDFDDDEVEVVPARKIVSGLSSAGSGLGIKVGDRSAKNLKELEEREVRGEDVDVRFRLPSGAVESAKFPIGQSVLILKAYLHDTQGLPIAEQVFRLHGRVMIDPMSLGDYDDIKAAKGPVDIEVHVASEAK